MYQTIHTATQSPPDIPLLEEFSVQCFVNFPGHKVENCYPENLSGVLFGALERRSLGGGFLVWGC